MEKVVIGTREIVEYRGKCPDCGESQSNLLSEAYVDVPCSECSKKRKEAKIREEYKHLIGCVITDVFGHKDLKSVKVKSSDGKEYKITSHHEFGRDEWLCVEVVKQQT